MHPYHKAELTRQLQNPAKVAMLPHYVPTIPSKMTGQQAIKLTWFAGLDFDPLQEGEFYLLLEELGLIRRVCDQPVTYEFCQPALGVSSAT